MAKRQFDRPAPGKYYTEAQRKEWGRAQDEARSQRNAPGYQKPAAPKRASRAKPVVFDGNSTCFSDLEYVAADGGVYATFIHKTAGTWFLPMSAAEARKWANADSYGSYFNDNWYGT